MCGWFIFFLGTFRKWDYLLIQIWKDVLLGDSALSLNILRLVGIVLSLTQAKGLVFSIV
jgi:hypothetical protein